MSVELHSTILEIAFVERLTGGSHGRADPRRQRARMRANERRERTDPVAVALASSETQEDIELHGAKRCARRI
jgi:hypothetical protein